MVSFRRSGMDSTSFLFLCVLRADVSLILLSKHSSGTLTESFLISVLNLVPRFSVRFKPGDFGGVFTIFGQLYKQHCLAKFD